MTVNDASLSLTVESAVGILKLNRPAKRNALNLEMLEAWPRLLDQAASDSTIRVLIVTGGAGVAFSAGADIEEMPGYRTDPAARDRFCHSFAAAQSAMADFPKPAIAMISGACVGGGCGLALGCDIRVADATAKLGITPAKIGLIYSVADTKRVVDAVGFGHAAELLYTGRLVGAAEAYTIGLVSRVVEPTSLQSETQALARAIAANAPSTLRSIKATLQSIKVGRSTDDETSRRAFAEAFQGPDFAEGLAAFLERRAPQFE